MSEANATDGSFLRALLLLAERKDDLLLVGELLLGLSWGSLLRGLAPPNASSLRSVLGPGIGDFPLLLDLVELAGDLPLALTEPSGLLLLFDAALDFSEGGPLLILGDLGR